MFQKDVFYMVPGRFDTTYIVFPILLVDFPILQQKLSVFNLLIY